MNESLAMKHEPAETPLTPESWGKLGMWIFLLLIGAHGLHVLGAVAWMATLAALAAAGRIASGKSPALDISTLYWYFVCAIWIVLFALVYLA